MKRTKKLTYQDRLYWYEQEKREALYKAKTQKQLEQMLFELAKKWRI